MNRLNIKPRFRWESAVKSKGLTYHTVDGVQYWNESAYYSFSMEEIDMLEAATNELHGMCIEAAGNIIANKRYKELGIRDNWVSFIEKSWNEEPPAIYGRFDLCYDGQSRPKMLEYNADTPTSLLESAVIQWFWLQDKFPKLDQWNSIHERLVAKWRELIPYLKGGKQLVHFAHMDTPEDWMTCEYLADTAREAGIDFQLLTMEEIGTNGMNFYDQTEGQMYNIFKLYPWEWLLKDKYANLINLDRQNWIEPAWKLLLSNKGILSILWEMYPNHPYLLPAYIGSSKDMDSFVAKPLMSREGENITIATKIDGSVVNLDRTKGLYGAEGLVYQEFFALPEFDKKHPVIGSWVIDGVSAGMGIREDKSLITGNFSQFVPHIIDQPKGE